MISEVFVCAGGPHAHFAADWNATAAALTKLGFAVLMGECLCGILVLSHTRKNTERALI